jgi:hypothetical protein
MQDTSAAAAAAAAGACQLEQHAIVTEMDLLLDRLSYLRPAGTAAAAAADAARQLEQQQ